MADNDKPIHLLKKELKDLLDTILDQEDFDSSTADDIQKFTALKFAAKADEAIQKLTALKCAVAFAPSTSSESSDSSGGLVPVPPEPFRCPISGELMQDPVLLTTGQTYDQISILKWFNKGHNTCPQTKEVLSDMTLTPNRMLRAMIMQWCLDNKLDIPNISNEWEAASNESRFEELLDKLLSPSLSDQKEAAKELREKTRLEHEFRAIFARVPNSIQRLLHPLSVDNVTLHPDLQEDLITTVLNVSIHELNKTLLVSNPLVLPLLIKSLQYGSIEAKANAAATIFSLSNKDEMNKCIIGNAGALEHLVVLLNEGHPVVIRDAASAIFNLCTNLENKQKAVCSGAVGSILRHISRGVLVDELVSVLALLSTNLKGIEEMCELDTTVACMLRIIRVSSAKGVKENCASILFAISIADRSKLKVIEEDEIANGTILELSRTGNSRAKRKASAILERLQRRADSRIHTA